jgi:hypothetical protein
MPSDEIIYNTLVGLFRDIPDTNHITIRGFRELLSEKLGLGNNGLDDKSEMIKAMVSVIMSNETPPNFNNGTMPPPGAPIVPVPMTFQRAVDVTAGLVRRKIPKPRFTPWAQSIVELCDLNVKDFHGANPIKTIVDIVLQHHEDIAEDSIKTLSSKATWRNCPWSLVLLLALSLSTTSHRSPSSLLAMACGM